MRLPRPLLRRNRKAHKNDFGHVLVVAGSPGMLGASALVSLAAMRSGAGLVTAAVPKSLNGILQKKITPVVMTWPVAATRTGFFAVSSSEEILRRASKYGALVIGPGLGVSPGIKAFVVKLISRFQGPVVVDADALNNLSPVVRFSGEPRRVFTPHPGEFLRLSGKSPHTDKERKAAALEFAVQHHVILVLKGAGTVVASPDGKVYVNTTGNAGMATAGAGDVLSGMIGAFLAQGLPPFEAAKWGVYLHGKAGDHAVRHASKMAMIATDIIDAIPGLWQ
ncbi:MAG: NAD(P)H-hydrate dehydratase [Candidatus Omnitrophica bacterium]|nr:NAD(P)H-hydrate dehydratase [Candidatus Omnitrophota bacterium]